MVESTKQNYEQLLKRIAKDRIYIFCPSNIIDERERNKDQDGKALYQGTEIKRYAQERNYCRYHTEEIVQKISSCLL